MATPQVICYELIDSIKGMIKLAEELKSPNKGLSDTPGCGTVDASPTVHRSESEMTTKKKEKEGEISEWDTREVDIERSGSKITLPELPVPMPIPEAIKALERKQREEEQDLNVHEVIDAFPLDGAVAFVKAMKEIYGWASPVPKMSFFGPIAPDLLTVQIGPGPKDYIQVPWGNFQLPNIESHVCIDSTRTPEGLKFVIYGTVKRREEHILLELARRTREILSTDSIYKGQSIRIKVDNNGRLELNSPPSFLDTALVRPEELVLSGDVQSQVDVSVFSPIRYTKRCREMQIPLKRGVLLEGKYGTGKTMTAFVTSRVCVENNWTFILLDDVAGLEEALLFAQRYSPAVVFAEDIDRITGDRDEKKTNALLNTIDGILSKHSEVITILTTNYVEKIHQSMMRPGRLDAVVSITPPDAEAVQRLIRLYSRGLVSDDENLGIVGTTLAGQIPATVREVVERSKLAMLNRGANSLSGEDLQIAALGMTGHLDLLNRPEDEPKSPETKLGESFATIIRRGGGTRDDLSGEFETLNEAVVEAADGVSDTIKTASRKGNSGAVAIRDKISEVKDDTKKILREVS